MYIKICCIYPLKTGKNGPLFFGNHSGKRESNSEKVGREEITGSPLLEEGRDLKLLLLKRLQTFSACQDVQFPAVTRFYTMHTSSAITRK